MRRGLVEIVGVTKSGQVVGRVVPASASTLQIQIPGATSGRRVRTVRAALDLLALMGAVDVLARYRLTGGREKRGSYVSRSPSSNCNVQ